MLDVDAQRRPEQRLLDVVDRERVAGKQHVHVAAVDQSHQMRPRAGVDHGRAGDDQDLPVPGPDRPHLRGNAPDHGRLRLLAGDAAGHKLERLIAPRR